MMRLENQEEIPKKMTEKADAKRRRRKKHNKDKRKGNYM